MGNESPLRCCPRPPVLVSMTLHSLIPHTANSATPCVTTIQCWKRHIWLERWFDQQAKFARSTSACVLCAVALQRMPCRYGDIVVHLLPLPTHPPTTKLSVTRLGSVASLCHDRGEHGVKLVAVDARVRGFGPTLRRTEGGRCACLFVFGLHSLLWQHWNYALGPRGHCFHPTSHPTQLPQLFNACTAPTCVGKLGFHSAGPFPRSACQGSGQGSQRC
jgi:hypothetical protein